MVKFGSLNKFTSEIGLFRLILHFVLSLLLKWNEQGQSI